MATTTDNGQGTQAPPSRLASVGGLVAVGVGIAAILSIDWPPMTA
jgi:hypothetical protein